MARSKFKDEHTFEKRKAEAERIRQKYTDRIPVICEKVEKSDIATIDKKNTWCLRISRSDSSYTSFARESSCPRTKPFLSLSMEFYLPPLPLWAPSTRNTKMKTVSCISHTLARTPLATSTLLESSQRQQEGTKKRENIVKLGHFNGWSQYYSSFLTSLLAVLCIR